MRVGVVIPCYNEAGRLPVELFRAHLSDRPHWHWLFVDDGSLDATRDILRDLVTGHDNGSVLSLARNSGKAEAVRQGVMRALSDHQGLEWVGYLDADLATSVEEFARLASRAGEQEGRMVVMGSRILRLGAKIARNPLRHYLGRTAATVISRVLRLPTYDTQCGAKLFRSDLASSIFDTPFESRWLFDVELLARSRNRLGRSLLLGSAVEEPLREWVERPGSKVRLRDLLTLPAEIWRIHRRYNGIQDHSARST